MQLSRAQRVLTKGLHECLQGDDGLVCRDFVASTEHVQERELSSGLEHTVLFAVDSVRH